MKKCTSNRKQHCEISRGLSDLNATERLREDILVSKAKSPVFLEHRDKHGQPTTVETTHSALGTTEKTRGYQCVDFAKKTACSCHSRDKRASWRGRPTTERHANAFEFCEPVATHFKQADFLRRTESVLHAAHHARRGMPIAFEAEHDINKMLEQLRSRERSFFRDMPNENHAATCRLRETNKIETTAAQLRDRSWRRRHIRAMHQLNRVDKHKRCARATSLFDDARDIRFAHHQHALAKRLRTACTDHRLEPLSAQPNLLRTFFARRIKRNAAARRNRRRRLHDERALANARVTAKQHHRARHDAAAEYAIEFADSSRQPWHARFRHAAQRDRAADP